jgi:hypothetical protein
MLPSCSLLPSWSRKFLTRFSILTPWSGCESQYADLNLVDIRVPRYSRVLMLFSLRAKASATLMQSRPSGLTALSAGCFLMADIFEIGFGLVRVGWKG